MSRILGVPRARLRQWERTALIEPSATEASAPAFGFRDLLCIKSVRSLLEGGVPLRRLRRCLELVRARHPELERPLACLEPWDADPARLVLRRDGAVFEPGGQLVLDFALPRRASPTVASLAESRRVDPPPDPDLAQAWFERGCQLDTRPETRAAAIDAYRRALEADPEFADAHCNLGTVHYQQGRRDEARCCYERALACDPRHVEANLNLAGLLEEDDQDRAALRHYRAALAGDPLRPDAHLAVALAYEKLGLRRRAREHWRRYLQLEPAGAWVEIARKRLSE